MLHKLLVVEQFDAGDELNDAPVDFSGVVEEDEVEEGQE